MYVSIYLSIYFQKLERWQGLPNINKVKQYEIVLPACLLSLFCHENKQILII